MTQNSSEATMLLTTSVWNGKPSFRLIPMTTNSLFVEGIFDSDNKVLVMITTTKKETFHMVPKLDEQGDKIRVKKARPERPDELGRLIPGLPYAEERRQQETFQEYYITEKVEIDDFIKIVAMNANKFDYTKYLDKSVILEAPKPALILP